MKVENLGIKVRIYFNNYMCRQFKIFIISPTIIEANFIRHKNKQLDWKEWGVVVLYHHIISLNILWIKYQLQRRIPQAMKELMNWFYINQNSRQLIHSYINSIPQLLLSHMLVIDRLNHTLMSERFDRLELLISWEAERANFGRL